ncbi:hypothetical protein CBR_g376 [Chara braunii]|uniref:Uncharacterized protein n=1 Tax=Chara braunii TaxID=69332 RepID=A0A388JQH7_CHABU|nr:hypothetical protein CBR_g376 [Chara braunii]|eukprot:GBG60045.1 hypothetical protein CBR_g376 [Chara braunii]
MSERVYDEINDIAKGNKTIYPDNVADTNALGGVQMPRSSSVAGESAVGGDGGDGNDGDGGSAWESGFSASSTGGNCKRKNIRQHTFDSIAEVTEKHDTMTANTMEGAQMDIPLWYAGAYIEDRQEDDDMAAHQESAVLRLASCFDDASRRRHGSLLKMSQSRLSRIGNAFCLPFAACMWIMRMGGDDVRSHEEASYYSQLVAKPTLLVGGSHAFNWRRHIVNFRNAVLSRLGKPPLTLGVFPNYIPEWAACRVRFNYNASLADPDVVARMDWMGMGPVDGERKDDGDDGDGASLKSSEWQSCTSFLPCPRTERKRPWN